jgi:hypothetical protein
VHQEGEQLIVAQRQRARAVLDEATEAQLVLLGPAVVDPDAMTWLVDDDPPTGWREPARGCKASVGSFFTSGCVPCGIWADARFGDPLLSCGSHRPPSSPITRHSLPAIHGRHSRSIAHRSDITEASCWIARTESELALIEPGFDSDRLLRSLVFCAPNSP